MLSNGLFRMSSTCSWQIWVARVICLVRERRLKPWTSTAIMVMVMIPRMVMAMRTSIRGETFVFSSAHAHVLLHVPSESFQAALILYSLWRQTGTMPPRGDFRGDFRDLGKGLVLGAG